MEYVSRIVEVRYWQPYRLAPLKMSWPPHSKKLAPPLALILPISQLQTQQAMTSQIRSHTEYLIQTYYIIVLFLQSKLMKSLALMFLTRFNDDILYICLLFWGHPIGLYRLLVLETRYA